MNRSIRMSVGVGLAILVLASEAAAQAPPPGATGLGAKDGKSVAFSWNAITGATWYYLWVNDANGIKYQRWYTNADVGCAAGQNTVCRIGIVLDVIPQSITWWVQTWGPGGFGPWSSAQSFAPGPHVAVVNSSGTLLRGNAVSAAALGTGEYQVIFGRDVTGCVFNVNVGGTQTGFEHGFASASHLSGNANGVYVVTADTGGFLADRPFHLQVECGVWPVGIG